MRKYYFQCIGVCAIMSTSKHKTRKVQVMNYQETVELEKNVKIKNDADEIYRQFLKNIKLSPAKFDKERRRYEIWSDSNNAIYVSENEGVFYFHCRFLHETYDLKVTPESIFSEIKSKYRGVDHLRASVGDKV